MNTVALDDIDHEILGALIQNGRATFTELGKIVDLSPHATADRVRRLVDMGVITGFSAKVSFSHMGRSLDAVISVRLAPRTCPLNFEQRAAQLPAIREIAFVTGRFDYYVRVSCRDAEDLDDTVRTLRREAGAAATETHIVMRCRSRGDAQPVEQPAAIATAS